VNRSKGRRRSTANAKAYAARSLALLALLVLVLLTALSVSLRRQALGADIKTGRPIDRGEGVDVVGRDLFVAVEVTLVAAVHLCVRACVCMYVTCRQQASKGEASQ
jgi:hypothetical protein